MEEHKRLCSSNVENIKGWFQNIGCPKTLVENQLKGVTKTRQISDQTYKRGTGVPLVTKIRQTSDKTYKRSNGVPLVLAYHPRLKNVSIIIEKYIAFLYAKEQVENIFTPPPFV